MKDCFIYQSRGVTYTLTLKEQSEGAYMYTLYFYLRRMFEADWLGKY